VIDALFYFFAAIAVAGALGMLLNVRNTVAAALSLVGTMVSLGAIYVLLDAYLIGVLQILVYAGAIVVLFLFVIMLLNLQEEPRSFAPPAGVAVAAVTGVGLSAAIGLGVASAPLRSEEVVEGFGAVMPLAERLFTAYLLPFELTSVLLLVAIVGAVVMGKKALP
jgi:NADH-quinone oxidoreductase subunit J